MTVSATQTARGFRLAFDVEQLDRSCAFYRATLGFEVTRTDRQGQIFECRSLASPRFPGAELELRGAFGKRVFACQPGGVLRFGLPVPSLPEAIRALAGKVRWVGTSPEATPDEPRGSVRFLDPDGYVIELYPER